MYGNLEVFTSKAHQVQDIKPLITALPYRPLLSLELQGTWTWTSEIRQRLVGISEPKIIYLEIHVQLQVKFMVKLV